MTPDDHAVEAPIQPPDALASLSAYLRYIAERHLGVDLRAKGGASDLVQTALLAAHQAGHQLRGRTPRERRGWLRRILVNALRQFRRRWRSRCRDVSREVPLDHPSARRQL